MIFFSARPRGRFATFATMRRTRTQKDARKAATVDTLESWYGDAAVRAPAPHAEQFLAMTEELDRMGAFASRRATVSDHFLLRRMGEVIVRTTSLDHMDAVHFTASDRAAAIASGFGRELRLLKEMHLDAEGSAAPRASRASFADKARRKSIALLGLQRRSKRAHGHLKDDGTSAGFVRGMAATIVDEEIEALKRERRSSVYERRGAGKLSSDEIVEQLKKFKDVRLTAGERLFLWLLGGFEAEDRELVQLNRSDNRRSIIGRV